jgi:ATP-dependent DNA helicase RecG
MPLTEMQIAAILDIDEETGLVEFKIQAPRPAELAERICGMANTRTGGTILFGIENAERAVVGLARPHETIDRIWTALRLVKPAVPLRDEEPVLCRFRGAQLVALQIAPNTGELFQAGGIFHIRKGSQTVPMTKEEIETRLAAFGTLPWEERLCPEATLDDLDAKLIEQYLAQRGTSGRRTRAYLALEEILIGLHCARRDPLSDTVRPTHAGILLFGRDPQFHLPYSEVVCVRYADSLGVGQYLDRKTFTGTLPELIDQTAEFLTRHIRVGAQIQGFRRIDLPEYPREALREAVVNAVVHRDYTATAESIRVFYYPDRVEVHSPGLLPPGLTPQDLAALRAPSRPRNRLLAQRLRDWPGYMEQVGSGIRLMVHEMRGMELPDPEFIEQHEFVVLFRNGTVPAGDPQSRLNPRQMIGLRIVQEKGSISTSEYVVATGAAERTALHDLRDMVDRGILATRGKTRTVRYYLP